MKALLRITLFSMLVLFCSTFTQVEAANEIYQVSTINALLQGVYDGEVTLKDLKQHGDFGTGTFQSLDGEMIGLDGDFYQIKSTGQVLPVDDTLKTPFAAVIHFAPEQTAPLGEMKDYDQLQKSLASLLNDQNYFYAIRIDGDFSYIKTRSVPAQEKPYKPLTEVTKVQPTFEFNNIKGTIIGFWCPQYVNGINVPGYHLHFISNDRQHGGHLLALSLTSGTVQLAKVTDFRMVLPQADDFRRASLGKDYSNDLKKAEQ